MKKFFYILAGSMIGLFIWMAPTAVAQGLGGCDNNPDTNCGVVDLPCEGVTDSTLCGSNTEQTIEDNSIFGQNGILTRAARIVAMIVGVASVIMIVVGGFQYIIASGDSTNITNAKNTILYAIIGLVVALVAQGIIMFVLVRL